MNATSQKTKSPDWLEPDAEEEYNSKVSVDCTHKPERTADRYSMLREDAADAARQLIYSRTENGRCPENDFPTEWFPSYMLRRIAEAVDEALAHGIRGFADVCLAAFLNAPDRIRIEFVECCNGCFPPPLAHCIALADKLHDFHLENQIRGLDDTVRSNADPIGELPDAQHIVKPIWRD